MKFLGNLFRSVSKTNSDRNDEFGTESLESKKKGFFDRVSEGVSSFVEGIRDRFRNRAMNVLEEGSLQDIALQESMDGGVVVTIDKENGVVRSTRWTNSVDDLNRTERKKLRSSSDRINATFERRPGQVRRRVSDSIWSQMSRKRREDNPGQPSSVKMTGTDGSANIYREGVSAVHSLLSLKYGVSLMAVENAYTDKGRSAESIKLSLLNRLSFIPSQTATDLVENYAQEMFVGGRVQSEVVTKYFEELLSRGIKKGDLNAVARDTASYAYALAPEVKIKLVEVGEHDHTGLFDGVDGLEPPRVASDSEFEAFSNLHLGTGPSDEGLEAFEREFPSEVIEGGFDNRTDAEIFGEKDEERGPRFVVGESVVTHRPKKRAGLQFEEFSLSEGSDSGAEIVTLEEFSDQMNVSNSEDTLLVSPEGDDLESVRAEYDRKLEEAKDEIRKEMAEKFGEVAEELGRQREDLGKLVLNLDETQSIVDSLVFRTLGRTAGLQDLSAPEIGDLDDYLSKGFNRPSLGFGESVIGFDEFSLGSPFSEVDETLEEPTVPVEYDDAFKRTNTAVGLRAVDKN